MNTPSTPHSITSLRRARWVPVVATLSALAVVGPAVSAAAAAPTPQDLAGVSMTCGDTVLTFTGGTQVGDLQRVLLGNGNQVVILHVVLHEATLSDTAGITYRAVGGANSTARVTTSQEATSLAGHFNVDITVLGQDGLAGKVTLRERTSRDGTVTSVTDGGCTL